MADSEESPGECEMSRGTLSRHSGLSDIMHANRARSEDNSGMRSTQELLSALLDGELEADDLDRLMATLDTDDGETGSALGTTARWAVVGSVMRGADLPRYDHDILGSVRTALASEPLMRADVLPMRRRARSRWMMPVGGLAAAASLAMAAVLLPGLVQQSDGPDAVPASTVAVDTVERRAAGERRSSAESRASTMSARREEQLNTFHIEYAGYRTVQGVGGPLGYARFAAHNADLRQTSGR